MIKNYDVCVLGGGVAGFASAVAAARAGATCALLEKENSLAGAGAHALVHSFCGLYKVGDKAVYANGGLAREIPEKMLTLGIAEKPKKVGKVFVLYHDPFRLPNFLEDICRETPGLDLFIANELRGVKREEMHGTSSYKLNLRGEKGENLQIFAKTLVDASGNATLAKFLQQKTLDNEGKKWQRPAFICAYSGMQNFIKNENWRLLLVCEIAHAVKKGELPSELLAVTFNQKTNYSSNVSTTFATINLEAGGENYEPRDRQQISKLRSEGERLARILHKFLRKKVAGEIRIVKTAAKLGIRQEDCWLGEYVLRGDDLRVGRRFDDAVAKAAWPIELRQNAARLELIYFKREGDIPLRALRARDLDDVFCCGRCASADLEANASLRVLGTCLASGQVAGVAAFLRASKPEIFHKSTLASREIREIVDDLSFAK